MKKIKANYGLRDICLKKKMFKSMFAKLKGFELGGPGRRRRRGGWLRSRRWRGGDGGRGPAQFPQSHSWRWQWRARLPKLS